MIGFDYIRKPIIGDRAKQISKDHPQSDRKANANGNPQKMPDKFYVPWK